jgi:hypothetical protein
VDFLYLRDVRETYPKFSPRTTRNILLKFKHYRAKKRDNYQNMLKLSMPLGRHITNEMRNMHASAIKNGRKN